MFLERADDLPLIDVREPRQVFFAILNGDHGPASHTKHNAHVPGDGFHCGFSYFGRLLLRHFARHGERGVDIVEARMPII
jgi:hypothetical protein